jgi:hypothetical protein
VNDDTGEIDGQPSPETIIALLFQSAMSGDPVAWAQKNELDPKLIEVWKFTYSQEYITYLEGVLRMIRTRR